MTGKRHHSSMERPRLPGGLIRHPAGAAPAQPAGAIELPEPTLHAAQPTYGFRVKSGLCAGAPSCNCTDIGTGCSAYGDNLWQDDLTLQ